MLCTHGACVGQEKGFLGAIDAVVTCIICWGSAQPKVKAPADPAHAALVQLYAVRPERDDVLIVWGRGFLIENTYY